MPPETAFAQRQAKLQEMFRIFGSCPRCNPDIPPSVATESAPPDSVFSSLMYSGISNDAIALVSFALLRASAELDLIEYCVSRSQMHHANLVAASNRSAAASTPNNNLESVFPAALSPPNDRWAYMALSAFKFNDPHSLVRLNELGQDGWEVCFVGYPSSYVHSGVELGFEVLHVGAT